MAEDAQPIPAHRVGLIGVNIGKSFSPALHEREAAALGLDYRYSLIDMAAVPESWGPRAGAEQGYTGFNVTRPMKQTVLNDLDELDDHARSVGAVNIIVVSNGRLLGHNTDGTGFMLALRQDIPDAELGRVLMVGGGGAGSAIAFALAAAGANVDVADVDTGRAAALVRRLQAEFPGHHFTTVVPDDMPATLVHADGVINATPIGSSDAPGLPFDVASLDRHHWVADIVYLPPQTELITAARDIGCRVLVGTAMLVAQAGASIELFTGCRPDISRMRRHMASLTG